MQVFCHVGYLINHSCPMGNKINQLTSPLNKIFEERGDKVYNSFDNYKETVINSQYES
jgi:hypothetical protein